MIFKFFLDHGSAHIATSKLISYFGFLLLVAMMSLVTACSSGGGDGTITDNTTIYYQDSDGDGYGDLANTQSATSQPAGYVTNKTDCNDSSAAINPGAAEANDGIDNNCDGQVDEGFVTYYQDADSDGYGDPSNTQVANSQPAGYVLDNTDCDDGSATVNPGVTEVSDGIDNDCDGNVDENTGGNLGLDSLSISDGNLDQVFQANLSDYTATVGFATSSVTVTAITANSGATISVNGEVPDVNNNSLLIALNEGVNSAINIVVTGNNSNTVTYSIIITRESAAAFAQQAYIKASNTGANDQFGYSVAISDDTLVVGAYTEGSNATGIDGNETDDSAIGSGAVYVFIRNGTTWSQQAYLKASNTDADDEFGYSVAIHADVLVVGAHQEASAATGVNGDETDNSTILSGAAYVFIRSGSIWSQQAYLKASNTDQGDRFGESVAIYQNTIAVGSNREASRATGVNGDETLNVGSSYGAVYVFTRSGTTWSQQAYVKASNSSIGDQFGYSVALYGDTLAVGANEEDSPATGINGDQSDGSNLTLDSGAVYVFTRNGTAWSQQAYIKASNTDAGDDFGVSVALFANTLVVGAIDEDSIASGINGNEADNTVLNAGAAYVFTRSGTTWIQQAYLKASNTDANDEFGYAISISGDTLAVGAYLEDSTATGVNGDETVNTENNSGAVYVFTRSGTTWTQEAYLKASNTDTGDHFGESLAVSGGTVAVGAYNESSFATGVNGSQIINSESDSGAVYVFE